MGYKTKKNLSSGMIHLFLILGSLCMLIPFAWMILTAFKTKSEAISVNPFYIISADKDRKGRGGGRNWKRQRNDAVMCA